MNKPKTIEEDYFKPTYAFYITVVVKAYVKGLISRKVMIDYVKKATESLIEETLKELG